MLPVISLYDERFSDIVENTRKMIQKFYPDWTDYNQHDPGITFIELFAWLKEMQQYHLDQIGVSNNIKFLKLFGVELRHIIPAHTYILVYDLAKTQVLPSGTKLSADGTIFETSDFKSLSPAMITDVFSKCQGKTVKISGQIIPAAGTMHFYIFGREPASGNEFYIGFNMPLHTGLPLSLYFGIFDDYQVNRNPIDNADFFPLASLKWEYYTEAGWKSVDIIKDHTNQFINSGSVDFVLEEAMAHLPDDHEKYWIRITLTNTDYEVAPVMNSLSLNTVEVYQRETLSKFYDFIYKSCEKPCFTINTYLAVNGIARVYAEKDGIWAESFDFQRTADISKGIATFTLDQNSLNDGQKVRILCYESEFAQQRIVGEGDGFPYQSFDLEMSELIYEDFKIMVSEGSDFSRLTEWYKVTDFDASSPTDRHYVFNDRAGMLEFGDCEHGLAPEGTIIIVGCATSLGRDGNIKEGKINRFVKDCFEGTVLNYEHANGGENSETIEEGFVRFRRSMHKIERAVTYEDYENLARATPGLMVKNCRAIPVTKLQNNDGSIEPNCISIVVQPFTTGKVKKLGPAYMENIYRQLSGRHLIGTNVKVLSPEYIGIDIFGEIEVKPYYRDAKQRIERAVEEFFSSTSWDFGSQVQYSTIYGIIDTEDCVSAIRSLTINAHGKGITRSINGDVILPPNGLVYLKEAEYVISEAE